MLSLGIDSQVVDRFLLKMAEIGKLQPEQVSSLEQNLAPKNREHETSVLLRKDLLWVIAEQVKLNI